MLKNLTNGEIILNIDPQFKCTEDLRFKRDPQSDTFQTLRKQQTNDSTFYIENIRTGQFSQISENYMSDTNKQNKYLDIYTTDYFQTQMKMLIINFQGKLGKSITFFQGIYAGMALLFTITLNLSASISKDLVRVEDQSVRVLSLLSTFGAFHSLINSKAKYDSIKIRGSASQIDQYQKCFILCVLQFIFYILSYILFNVSHQSAVSFNIQQSSYKQLSTLTTVYTILALLGWIVTNANTYKYQI